MGFTGVSFYVDWGLVEGNSGHVVTDGIWSLEKFFQAATQAGIYLIARPGPYINAETTAGGIPGWVLRLNATIRSDDPEYLNATTKYMSTLGGIIEKAQITHGGPVILVQPENEYTTWPGVTDFPSQMNKEYMAAVEDQLLNAGITVPLIVNDNEVEGANPSVWPTYKFPHNWQTLHEQQSPTTPFAIAEFQGGSGEGWGGVLEEMCGELLNEEAVRVVYKNNYSFGVKLFNIYMTYGGTNWGNLGYMNGYTSYDYGAAITEERGIWREKYSEEKLEANFLKASPAYLTATPGIGVNGSYGAPASTNFSSTDNTQYTITLPTSIGNVTIPQLGGSLTLYGRDSKFHVTDYDLGGINLIYSSAEILTWTRGAGSAHVLILYGGAGEKHEFALARHLGNPTVIEGSGITIRLKGSISVIQWEVKPNRRIVRIGDLEVYLLWRNEAYNYWPLEAGYLMRSASLCGENVCLTGDVNVTTEIELISSTAKNVRGILFNGDKLKTSTTGTKKLSATVEYNPPRLDIPVLEDLSWKYLDTLPEIATSYDDSTWINCSKPSTNNPRDLSTPKNLYAMDYGFHTGSLIYRGHFTANGQESNLWLNVSGGTGFGHSVWLNDTFLGSWTGSSANSTVTQDIPITKNLTIGKSYVVTILIDNMGQDEEAPGTDVIKFPKGILNYELSGHNQSGTSWKVTGNLGGEQYQDLVRGPLNEGSMYPERQGYHYPKPPNADWKVSNPVRTGLAAPGVGFYTTSFNLEIPDGWDIPMSFVFNSSADTRNVQGGPNYRCQLFVNGYQFGKYINNLGPQTSYPVPEGILNYRGTNYVAITLWAQDAEGAQLGGISLVPRAVIRSGYSKPGLAPQPAWTRRPGAY
ncbi:Glycoside hydrolase family 35 [Penicillium sp. IBT 16267x]|nr:Glycoside hydrolase family 35 [Penicillium sp. IBT 16267x]